MKEMAPTTHRVMLSLASNTRQQRHLEAARRLLPEVIDGLRYTTEHWTEPVDSQRTDQYLNQLATGTTTLDADTLNGRLKAIEQQLDRKHDKRGVVTIDIDLLQYDDTRHHLRDWERNYVKDLLKEL